MHGDRISCFFFRPIGAQKADWLVYPLFSSVYIRSSSALLNNDEKIVIVACSTFTITDEILTEATLS